MKRIAILLALALGMTLQAAPAAAAGCDAELAKLCKDVQKGEGRILKCLRDHDAELSDECRAFANTASQYMACLDDALHLCPNIEPGGARAIACLRGRMSDLSSECKRELDRIKR